MNGRAPTVPTIDMAADLMAYLLAGELGKLKPGRIANELGITYVMLHGMRTGRKRVRPDTAMAWIGMLMREFGYPHAVVVLDPDTGRGWIRILTPTREGTC